jgi:hypothetical protein
LHNRPHLAVTAFLRAELPAERDPEALAADVMAAVGHYWIMADVYGGRHPHEVDTERFLRALVRLVVPEGQDVAQQT